MSVTYSPRLERGHVAMNVTGFGLVKLLDDHLSEIIGEYGRYDRDELFAAVKNHVQYYGDLPQESLTYLKDCSNMELIFVIAELRGLGM